MKYVKTFAFRATTSSDLTRPGPYHTDSIDNEINGWLKKTKAKLVDRQMMPYGEHIVISIIYEKKT